MIYRPSDCSLILLLVFFHTSTKNQTSSSIVGIRFRPPPTNSPGKTSPPCLPPIPSRTLATPVRPGSTAAFIERSRCPDRTATAKPEARALHTGGIQGAYRG